MNTKISSEVDKQKMFAKMDRKLLTLRNLLKRYRSACPSTDDQCQAYDAMREEMRSAGFWAEWCRSKQYHFDHNSSDHLA